MANRDYGKTRSGSSVGYKKDSITRMESGGVVEEAQAKQSGLASTAGESVGFFERLRAGNIDDPKSEAYSRWGAGAGRRNAASAASEGESEDYTPAKTEAPKSYPTESKPDEREERDAARAASTYKQADTPAPKAAAKPAAAKPATRRGVTPFKAAPADAAPYSNEGRNKPPVVSRNKSAVGGAIDRARSTAQTHKPSLIDRVMSGEGYKDIDDSGKSKSGKK